MPATPAMETLAAHSPDCQHLAGLTAIMRTTEYITPRTAARQLISPAGKSTPTMPCRDEKRLDQTAPRTPDAGRRVRFADPRPTAVWADWSIRHCCSAANPIELAPPKNQQATIGVSARVSLFLAANQLQSHITLARGCTFDSLRLWPRITRGSFSVPPTGETRLRPPRLPPPAGNQNGMEE